MKRSVRVVLGGKPWTIKLVKRIRDRGEDCFGLCDFAKSTIYLEESLTGPKLVRFLLHESMHAQMDWLAEEYVDQYSMELADALHKSGLFDAEAGE